MSQPQKQATKLAKLPLPILIVVVAVYFLMTYVFPTEQQPARQEGTAIQQGTALEQLETLEIKGRAPKTGYSRDQFGNGWLDPDGNGCDGRNDILQRDLDNITLADNGCIVLSGVLDDKFTGETINFLRGPDTSSAVQIDHVVALSDSWQKGAQELTEEQRQRFANDPLNLLAVDGPANQQKSDADTATWLPPNKAFRCEFVSIQTAVKAKYELWITQAEYDAIQDVLDECPSQPVYTTEDELPVLRP